MRGSEFIRNCGDDEKINLTHFIIVNDRDILFEYCRYPYDMKSLRLFFSMTKSITSLAVGIAVGKGLFSLDDPVYQFFKDKLPSRPHPNMFKIKIRHLLTMSVGIDHNTYPELAARDDWVKAFFEEEFPNEPGTKYLYSTHASHMLSAIITIVSKTSLEAFLRENLFSYMGIADAQWEYSPENLTAGGMGLSLTPKSVIKIARLLLNHGAYGEKQLVPKEYLAEATVPQIKKEKNGDHYFQGDAYGYQFHIARDDDFYLDGAFGQLLLVCPDKKLAFIAFSQNSKTERLLAQIYRHFIYDRFEGEKKPLSAGDKTEARQAMDHIAFPCGRFALEGNPLRITSLKFHENEVIFTHINHAKNIIEFDFEGAVHGRAWFIKDLQEHEQEYVSEVVCAAMDRFVLRVYWIETPYAVTYDFEFTANHVVLKFDINVSFTLRAFEVKGIEQDP